MISKATPWFLLISLFCFTPLQAENTFDILATEFVGGDHQTFYWSSDKQQGEGYEFQAARKVAIFSKGVEGDRSQAQFTLDRAPTKPVKLKLMGLDDSKKGSSNILVSVNGVKVHEGATGFPDNPHCYAPRGWKALTIELNPKQLKKGVNSIRVENTMNGYGNDLRWVILHKASLEFAEKSIAAKVVKGEDFLGRHYLEGKIESFVYPAVLKKNVVHLIKGHFVQTKFPRMITLDYKNKKADQIVELPANVNYRKDSANLVKEEKITRDGKPYVRVTFKASMGAIPGRLISYAGLTTLYLSSDIEGDLSPIYVRHIYEGEVHPERAYKVKVWPKMKNMQYPKEYYLGIWGLGKPKNESIQDDFGKMMYDYGYRLVFGTTVEEEARYFRKHGIKYYTRFGPQHPSKKYPTIKWDGTVDTKHADPIHLIYDKSAINYPTYQRAIEAAKKDWLDGVCCDYELLCDSWSDRSIAEFKRYAPQYRKHTKEQLKKLATGPDGRYKPFTDWMNYRRWLNARVVGRMQREMRKINPDMPYLSLASASDMPCLWWDGTNRGRFRLRDLANEVSEIACSVYHYDNPGGLPSIPAIVDTTRRFALGKKVGVHQIGIFSGTLIELYRYGKCHLPSWSMRMNVLLGGIAGGKAFHFFSGFHLDGDYIYAGAQGLKEFAMIEPHIEKGHVADDYVKVSYVKKPKYRLPMSASYVFGVKLLWHGELEHQSYQMLRQNEDGSLALFLFNFMDTDVRQRVSITLPELQGKYQVSSILGNGTQKGAVVSPEGFEWTVPKQDVQALLLKPTKSVSAAN